MKVKHYVDIPFKDSPNKEKMGDLLAFKINKISINQIKVGNLFTIVLPDSRRFNCLEKLM